VIIVVSLQIHQRKIPIAVDGYFSLVILEPSIYNLTVAEIARWNDIIRRISSGFHLLAVN